MEREEGEMSDDDSSMLVDEVESLPQRSMDVSKTQQTVMFMADKNGLLVKQLEKIDAFKLEERAKRFGLDLTGNKVVTQRQIDELYANLGVESGNERHFRFDAIHLNGVYGLTTREIFEYLEDFKPVSLEWIDNTSCNIVCQDHISAALALLVHSREIQRDDMKNMLADKSDHHWREGFPHPKNDLILMRFATNGDKKMPKNKPDFHKQSHQFVDQSMDAVNKNPWGDLCQTWGVYDHQEIFQRKAPGYKYEDEKDEIVQIKNKRLAMRLGKRGQKTCVSDDSDSDSEWKKKSKTPRMRMHADDEETKHKKILSPEESREPSSDRDVYAPLSIEVVNSKSHYIPKQTTKLSDKFKINQRQMSKSTMQSRLGSKVTQNEALTSDDSSADSVDADHNVMSRVQKMNTLGSSSVWSRLENKNIETEEQSDLRNILKSKRQKNPDDLRERLSKTKQSNLRIEIDNNYARS
ncbi:unnamed protein product [Chilo suppressalis]|uniref:Nuclear cap-binding protein subunit 3 n=1 Tax=Chilo suppressalis TaxID=168631 RepID=A0ABN8BC27_CHISP|nr:unnamed protein product [Chilo suppressalis]